VTLFSYNIKKMIKEQTNCFHGLYSKCGYPEHDHYQHPSKTQNFLNDYFRKNLDYLHND